MELGAQKEGNVSGLLDRPYHGQGFFFPQRNLFCVGELMAVIGYYMFSPILLL